VGLVEVGDGKWMCHEMWSGARRTAYGVFTNLTQFVLPFITIFACYSAIIRKLRERSEAKPGTRLTAANLDDSGSVRSSTVVAAATATAKKKEEAERARTQRTNRMLISMVSE
jgi:hypothetical protein